MSEVQFVPSTAGLAVYLHNHAHRSFLTTDFGFDSAFSVVHTNSWLDVKDHALQWAMSIAWVPMILTVALYLVMGAFLIYMSTRCCCRLGCCGRKMQPDPDDPGAYWAMLSIFAAAVVTCIIVGAVHFKYLKDDVDSNLSDVDSVIAYKDSLLERARAINANVTNSVDIAQALLDGCPGYSTPCSDQLKSDLSSAVDNSKQARDASQAIIDQSDSSFIKPDSYIDPVRSWETLAFGCTYGLFAFVGVLIAAVQIPLSFPKVCNLSCQGVTIVAISWLISTMVTAFAIPFYTTAIGLGDVATFDPADLAGVLFANDTNEYAYANYYVSCVAGDVSPLDQQFDKYYEKLSRAASAASDLEASLIPTGISDDTLLNITAIQTDLNFTQTLLNETKVLVRCNFLHDVGVGIFERFRSRTMVSLFVIAVSIISLLFSHIGLSIMMPQDSIASDDKHSPPNSAAYSLVPMAEQRGDDA